jgi:anaerobic magnesium-protoporphyrin IX monomethyl ester cyclase
MVKTMKNAGCHMIALGIESGSEQMLVNMKKGITLEDARNAIAMLNRNKIESAASFVVGFPGETKETLRATRRFVKEINPTFAAFFRLIPYPGTILFNQYLKQEKLVSLDISNFKELGQSRTIRIKNISEEDIRKAMKLMYLSFYFRPSKILHHLIRLFSFNRFVGYVRGLFWLYFQKK